MKNKREELLAEVERLQALQEKEDSFKLISSGLKKLSERIKREYPLLRSDLIKYGKGLKNLYLEIKGEIKPIMKKKG